MNVLFVIHTPRDIHTAVYKNCCHLGAFLEKQGHKATILTPQDFPDLTRWHSRWVPIFYPFWVAWWLLRWGEEYDLAVFHSFAGWVVNLFRWLIPSYQRLRTLTSFHGLEPLYYDALKREMEKVGQPLRLKFRLIHGVLIPWLVRLSCRRSDRIMCLNCEEADYLVRNKWADKSRVAVISNGVPQEFFIPREYAPEARRLLFVGQWQEMKGIRYLVEVFSMLARQAPELELWCMGTLLEEEKVLARFPENLRSRVVVSPRLEHKELLAVYRDADMFLFPSLSEGFSTALLEAMAMALPVVATPVGAAPDFLESGVNALLVPKGDATALADSVRRLLNDVTLRERLGFQAQVTAAEYEMKRVDERVVSLFEEALMTKTSLHCRN